MKEMMDDHEESEERTVPSKERDVVRFPRTARTMDEYLDAALAHRQVEDLQEGGIFVSIPAMRGVWGNGATLEEALAELRAGVEGWVALVQQRGEQPPTFSGIAAPKHRAV